MSSGNEFQLLFYLSNVSSDNYRNQNISRICHPSEDFVKVIVPQVKNNCFPDKLGTSFLEEN